MQSIENHKGYSQPLAEWEVVDFGGELKSNHFYDFNFVEADKCW